MRVIRGQSRKLHSGPTLATKLQLAHGGIPTTARAFAASSAMSPSRASQKVPVRSQRRSQQAGFTLLEMMTVVIMITILASATIPLATRQLRDRRTQDVAQRIATMYQSARMRAMGRGSATLVRYTAGTPGSFAVLEAQRGPNDTAGGAPNVACAALPVSSCLTTDWINAASEQYRSVSTLDFSADAGLTVVMNGGTNLDICFTPMGRTYAAATGQPLVPVSDVYTATVGRSSGNVRSRQVLVLPNGAARLSL